ncbi:hypothetical protein Tco_0977136 [Tanacetum coccineum]|uniref:Uncharacterized protein n=1 Tax=Tanacetum coccineum TaxID=301880 RepID=A0ABQ5EJA1_9ASTR
MENDLELKLTVSEYERQQLIEEAACLNDKMHKTLNLENEKKEAKNKTRGSSAALLLHPEVEVGLGGQSAWDVDGWSST